MSTKEKMFLVCFFVSIFAIPTYLTYIIIDNQPPRYEDVYSPVAQVITKPESRMEHQVGIGVMKDNVIFTITPLYIIGFIVIVVLIFVFYYWSRMKEEVVSGLPYEWKIMYEAMRLSSGRISNDTILSESIKSLKLNNKMISRLSVIQADLIIAKLYSNGAISTVMGYIDYSRVLTTEDKNVK